ncbi:hypothetical protein [Aliidiomarina haloalkalitolerans]|uniref:Uncharacterized protein n=1 Tax=Aliidiomarina haloalkalitolerans TaxID=859059 RepID=A0A432VYT5_9GAMM|nr:hypothetical protein [Aliidiomarina haloalkalitolerans]MCL5255047.1 hypothetical protein [Gammaproteobacteria bacterium]RUO21822.1 hypothetical protein CWE06_02945 [Aliidiomarina haloalkalitolerans]
MSDNLKLRKAVVLSILILPHTIIFVSFGHQIIFADSIWVMITAIATVVLAFSAYFGLISWKQNESKLLFAKLSIDALEQVIKLENTIVEAEKVIKKEAPDYFIVSNIIKDFREIFIKVQATTEILNHSLAREASRIFTEMENFLLTAEGGRKRVEEASLVADNGFKELSGEVLEELSKCGLGQELENLKAELSKLKSKLISSARIE